VRAEVRRQNAARKKTLITVRTWACGPPKELKIALVVTPAQAAVHVSPEEAGFPPFGKLRASFSRE
jgi:hypothetical protein